MAENISKLASAQNIDRIGRILEDIEALTDAAADSDDDIRLIIDNVATMTIILRRNVEALDQTADLLNVILVSFDELLTKDAKITLTELSEAADETSKLVAQMNDILEENRPAIDAFAQEGLGATVGVIAQANRVLATTEAILQEFDRDPARFLLGEARPEARP